MSELQNIPVAIMDSLPEEQAVTPNVRALLTEICSMLATLISEKKTNSIDLHSLPLLSGEYETIKTILGKGEITASLESLGSSQIYETVLPGVWWIIHNNEHTERMTEVIEITRIPSILKSQHADIEAAHSALQQQLQEWSYEH